MANIFKLIGGSPFKKSIIRIENKNNPNDPYIGQIYETHKKGTIVLLLNHKEHNMGSSLKVKVPGTHDGKGLYLLKPEDKWKYIDDDNLNEYVNMDIIKQNFKKNIYE